MVFVVGVGREQLEPKVGASMHVGVGRGSVPAVPVGGAGRSVVTVWNVRSSREWTGAVESIVVAGMWSSSGVRDKGFVELLQVAQIRAIVGERKGG